MTTRETDLIVIGAGPVGENVADYAKKRGLDVVIVERELVGGDCSYWACMPSKALLRPGIALRAAKAVGGAREAVAGGLDTAAVLERRDSFVSAYDDSGQVEWLLGAGIELVRGSGRLAGPKRVEVTDADGAVTTTLVARHAVAVCTGSGAALLPVDGLADARPWTPREATGVEQPPARLAVIGGGVVGCEMATAYASLGTAVTLISRSGLLGGNEPFAGELVGDALRELGVDVRTGTSPTRVDRNGADEVVLTFEDGTTVTADEVLVAAGRTPRSEHLGLETVGLTPGEYLDVDDTLLVRGAVNAEEPWLYAVGDINHRALLTHQGKYQARAAGEVIAARALGADVDDSRWGAHVATADDAAVPQVTFTDPEVASVGLTLAAAEDRGLPVRAIDYDLGAIAGASLHADGYTGQARIVVDTDRDVIVGATFVGPDVAELLQSATIAVVGEVPIARLWHAVPAYPTISEIWLRLLETIGRPPLEGVR